MRLFLSSRKRLDVLRRWAVSWRKEGEHVQCERAGFTVTKQQSNKSAFALRNVNPCSAILRSSQRLENSQTENKKLEILQRFNEKSRCEKEEGGESLSQWRLAELRSNLRWGSPVRQQPEEVSAPRTAHSSSTCQQLRAAPLLPPLPPLLSSNSFAT